jgi:four helix bundle protein
MAEYFLHFLHIARGSLFETMTLIELFEMRNWIKPETTQLLYTQADEIEKKLLFAQRSKRRETQWLANPDIRPRCNFPQ